MNGIRASKIYPGRSGECFLTIYLLTKNKFWIEEAFKNRKRGFCRLCVYEPLYSTKDNAGYIEKLYYEEVKVSYLKEITKSF